VREQGSLRTISSKGGKPHQRDAARQGRELIRAGKRKELNQLFVVKYLEEVTRVKGASFDGFDQKYVQVPQKEASGELRFLRRAATQRKEGSKVVSEARRRRVPTVAEG